MRTVVGARPAAGVAAGVAALLLTVGCAATGQTDQTAQADATAQESEPPTTDEAAPQSPQTSPAAPETTKSATAATTKAEAPEQLRFSSQTLDGQPFEGSSLAGRPVVLWFWAPWCPNCQREAPGVARVATASDDVTFLGVAAQDDVEAMRGFVDDFDVDMFDHLADVDAEVWQRFGVTYQPAYAFISPDGSVEVVKGGLAESELADRVAGL